jgi:hypothetical protein
LPHGIESRENGIHIQSDEDQIIVFKEHESDEAGFEA